MSKLFYEVMDERKKEEMTNYVKNYNFEKFDIMNLLMDLDMNIGLGLYVNEDNRRSLYRDNNLPYRTKLDELVDEYREHMEEANTRCMGE